MSFLTQVTVGLDLGARLVERNETKVVKDETSAGRPNSYCQMRRKPCKKNNKGPPLNQEERDVNTSPRPSAYPQARVAVCGRLLLHSRTSALELSGKKN